MVCPNISPDIETGADTWKDEDFVRRIREGIGYDGRTLHSTMPYWNLRTLTDEDLASVIVYIYEVFQARWSAEAQCHYALGRFSQSH